MSDKFSGTATIHQFPPRGRFALRDNGENFAQNSAPVASVQLPRGARLGSGGGWYHDAAIQDSNKDASEA